MKETFNLKDGKHILYDSRKLEKWNFLILEMEEIRNGKQKKEHRPSKRRKQKE